MAWSPESRARRRARLEATPCRAPGCYRSAVAADGLCWGHYRERTRTGKLTPPKMGPQGREPGRCSFPCCARPRVWPLGAREEAPYCNRHNIQLRGEERLHPIGQRRNIRYPAFCGVKWCEHTLYLNRNTGHATKTTRRGANRETGAFRGLPLCNTHYHRKYRKRYLELEAKIQKRGSILSSMALSRGYHLRIAKEWPKRRKAVIDAYDGYCDGCGEETPVENIEVDHILELVDGGDHSIDNLQCLCAPCHRSKTKEHAKRRAAFKRESAPQYVLDWFNPPPDTIEQRRSRNARRKRKSANRTTRPKNQGEPT